MPSDDQESTGLTESQRSGIERRRLDQDRTLEAMQELEVALSAAAPRREARWHQDVLASLTILGETTSEEADNAARPDSLLSDISRTQPRLRNRVRGLRTQYRQLHDAIDALRGELGEPGDEAVDFADIRQRLAWVLTALRHQRARESDLIYEAYYDAFHVDLRVEGGQAPRTGEDDRQPEP